MTTWCEEEALKAVNTGDTIYSRAEPSIARHLSDTSWLITTSVKSNEEGKSEKITFACDIKLTAEGDKWHLKMQAVE